MKQALLLADKLATKAKLVTEADVKKLSWRISDLELTLNEYNKYILNNKSLSLI